MYDVIIIGCGPAGMTAAIYAARANKKVLVLEKETIGGQMSSSPLIENYPGYTSISGSELACNMFSQMTSLGVEFELEEVQKIEDGGIKKVVTDEKIYEAKTLILATGAKHCLLGLKREEDFIGKGIHFCVSCDGAFFKNREVAVVGGGNSALINALSLSSICKKVFIFQNKDHLTAEKILIEQISTKKNIEVYVNTTVTKIIGETELEKVEINMNNLREEKKIDGMFLSIGLSPESTLVKNILKTNSYGYIKSCDCKTEISGLFVAGDCRDKKIRQITAATNDGTLAAMNAIEYLENIKF